MLVAFAVELQQAKFVALRQPFLEIEIPRFKIDQAECLQARSAGEARLSDPAGNETAKIFSRRVRSLIDRNQPVQS